MVSDKRLSELADEKMICKLSWEEEKSVAQELQKLRQMHQWIPVIVRLPDDTTQCVVKTIFDGVYAIQHWDSNSGTWLGDDYSYDADEVTHWMPLPELPA